MTKAAMPEHNSTCISMHPSEQRKGEGEGEGEGEGKGEVLGSESLVLCAVCHRWHPFSLWLRLV
jgi:hypothetical protein